MIILGIDPGFLFTGYAIIKKEGSKTTLLECNVLKLASTKSLSQRIGIFFAFFTQKVLQYKVTDVSLETPFLGKNAQNFLKLGYLRGILYLLADTHQLNLHEFSPSQVKLSVTGFGGADKDQVARMMLRLFPGLQMPQKLDVTDALAVTLCGVWHSNVNQQLQKIR